MPASNVRIFSPQQPADTEAVVPLRRNPANEADLYRSAEQSRMNQADSNIQVLQCQRICVDEAENEQVAAIRERALAEEAAVVRQAAEERTEIDRKLSENHLIKARCEAALAIQE